MTLGIHAIALFADDLREEIGGKETLIGIYPDTIEVPSMPGALGKIVIYIRIHVPIESKFNRIIATLRHPDGQDQPLGEVAQDFMVEPRKKSIESGGNMVGLIFRTVISPLVFKEEGRFRVLVNIDGEEILCGSLNAKLDKPTKA